MALEDDKPDTLAEAMAALEKGLTEYFEQEGIEVEYPVLARASSARWNNRTYNCNREPQRRNARPISESE